MNIASVFDSLGRDLRHALRGMLRRPAFTSAVVLTLAIGIGANTAIFSVVNAVLLKPLAYPSSHELVSVAHSAPGANTERLNPSASMYFTYRDENQTLEHIGLWGHGGSSITGIGEPEQARTVWVTDGTLQALGVQPMLGRWFSEAETAPGADGPEPVILTHAYWQRRFGGDETALGRALTIDQRPAQIIGVMPAGFRFLNVTPPAEVIRPQALDRSTAVLDGFGPQAVARLKPGVSIAETSADLERMLPIWLSSWPERPGGVTRAAIENWRIAPALRPLKDDVVGGVASTLWVLMGTIGAVLLIACANVANLMLVRADSRRAEFAVRSALGARRRRIVKELLIESSVLGVAGGVLGLVFAYIGLKALVALGPTALPRLNEIAVDPLVLAFALGASLVSSLLFGSIPALKLAALLGAPLAGGGRGATAGRERNAARNTLVIAQVALALVLIVSSGLMFRTFEALRDVDPGVAEPHTVQTARISIIGPAARDPQAFTRTEREILGRIAAIPGVESASFASAVPMEGRISNNPVFVEGQTYAAGETPPFRLFRFVSPGHFRTMGTRMIAGRDVTWTDIDNGGRVAVVSENFAREVWDDPAAALGKRIREASDGPWREIVGVAQDVHENALQQPPPATVYWPILAERFWNNQPFGIPNIIFAVRSARAGTASLVEEIRQAVWSVNSDLPVFLVFTMQELYGVTLARTSFTLALLAIAGSMALGLGVIGIYGVIAYAVAQRTREIGIRLALGAPPRQVQSMVVLHGLSLTALGVAAGLVVAVALTRWMTSLLFGVGPLDPWTYTAGLSVLVAAAALASYLPARRAAAIDPVVTLKAE